MSRPVTLFTGQWADLTFEDVCKMMSGFGYDGLEIACWGDHMDVRKAATDPAYVEERKAILKKYNLGCWALGAHLSGQAVADKWDERLDVFVPDEVKGKPDEIKAWAAEEMKYTAQAAKNMGCYVVTGFTGSPVWKYWYSFPPTPDEMVENAYKEVVKLWTPILDEFDKQGVKFGLEVHPSEIAYDFYTTQKLLDAFDRRPAFGLNFDPSHLVWQGVEPHLFIREFADRIYHVHMKDAGVTLDGKAGILGSHLPFGDTRRGWNFRSLGHGSVNFEDIIRELNAANYTGPLSVEWEDNGMDREFGAKESADFVKKVNFLPSTIAFDGSMES
ncbi:AP endonuclease [candidate division KSB3 bacterium]|uniref:AP endonuclease n=1 Tax=candidate division KSB3 bacterium TaxID=2044937 RepID=A0A2G6KBY7_9BACT|nr:MAG: AP endonuclease [candidate division KSB3 bacterium]